MPSRYVTLIGVDDAARLLHTGVQEREVGTRVAAQVGSRVPAPNTGPKVVPDTQPDTHSDVQPNATPVVSPALPLLFDCRFDLADVRAGEAAYAAAHLPGAHYLDLERDLSGPKTGRNGRHPLPARETLAGVLAAHGMTRDRQVIAYDAQGGIFAARLWWLLRWLGHEAVAVLDGGLPAWREAGLPVTDRPSPALPGKFAPAAPLTASIEADALMASLPRAERLIVDARSPDRYRGENETLDPVGGHIPGAINRFFKNNLTGDGRFKPAALLREEFTALLGTVPPARTVMQCGSGVTACHNLLAMEVAGLHQAVLYPGSWSEWCADPARPVATGDAR